jgi:hypothetical protein
MAGFERAFDRRLAQIVAIGTVAGQPSGKAPHLGQQLYEGFAEMG